MKNIQVDLKNALSFLNQDDFKAYADKIAATDKILESKTGKGNDFLGWMNLPENISESHINDINKTANDLTKDSEVVLVIGIGGSYLGAKSVIDALSGQFDNLKKDRNKPLILFAGQNLSEDYHYELLDFLKDKKYSIIVISKSGTTTEPAIAFRLFRKDLENRFGNADASKRIVAITDAKKGALREMTNQENYKSFVIDDDIGGRYSVLTAVGLLPIACAGFDIKKIVEGAVSMLNLTKENSFDENPVYKYAAIRNALYLENKTVEILANYNTKLNYIAEWWKQLFGESDGKENKGIFPASVSFTTDLHSMGQYVQEGLRNIFETVISVEKSNHSLLIPNDNDNFDQLNFLSGKAIDYVNKMAELGTTLAHIDGNVPNIKITMPEINEYYLGQLLYFFEKSCAIGGYLLDINPFDQPGVEAYKKNMFALLDKPGFEEESESIKRRLEL